MGGTRPLGKNRPVLRSIVGQGGGGKRLGMGQSLGMPASRAEMNPVKDCSNLLPPRSKEAVAKEL